MCGIGAHVAKKGNTSTSAILEKLLEGMEYRGYDSCGIALLVGGTIQRERAPGKLVNLKEKLLASPLLGNIGIAHTRWATHGKPGDEFNAHPHLYHGVAVVHNGIIENFELLKGEMEALGHVFESDTDTEVIAHLVAHYRDVEHLKPVPAARKAIARLIGAFAIVILVEGNGDHLVVARKGSPLAIGYGDGEMFVASDAISLEPFTLRIRYLDEGDYGVVSSDGADLYDEENNPLDLTARPIKIITRGDTKSGKNGFAHHMLNEIHQQPGVVADTIASLIDRTKHRVVLPDATNLLNEASTIAIIACGTASYAGLVSQSWFEELTDKDIIVDVGSNFRYRKNRLRPSMKGLFISQSGETADTLESLRRMKRAGCESCAIVNVPESTLLREADAYVRTLAGPERSVASTKAFTTQLATLAAIAIGLGRASGEIDAEKERELVQALDALPRKMQEVLNTSGTWIDDVVRTLVRVHDVMYIARDSMYAIALEGALKLKEVSYIHAEGQFGGEIKHGPLALLDENVPTVVIAPTTEYFDKIANNLQVVAARESPIILVTDAAGAAKLGKYAKHTIVLPDVHPFVAPILYTLVMQLIAYYVAVRKGTDVDQPRNLAKSVTVE